MSVKFSKRKLLITLYSVGALLLVATAIVSWDHRNIDPERVFWGTIDQGMKTSGVTVKATQSAEGSSLNQTIQYSMGGQNVTRTLTALTQSGTAIVDETIGTPTADYTRYTSIKTDQKTASGKTMDFSKVLGTWAKTDHVIGESQQLPQAILGTGLPLGGVVIPIAQLQPEARDKLAAQIKKDNVYKISFKDAVKSTKDGRLYYTYKASIKPSTYASMMQLFGASTGLHNLDSLKPEQYEGQPPFTLNLTIDARAHTLVSATTDDGAIKQTYTGYNMPTIVKLPAQTISSAELQKRLQQMQQ